MWARTAQCRLIVMRTLIGASAAGEEHYEELPAAKRPCVQCRFTWFRDCIRWQSMQTSLRAGRVSLLRVLGRLRGVTLPV